VITANLNNVTFSTVCAAAAHETSHVDMYMEEAARSVESFHLKVLYLFCQCFKYVAVFKFLF
jgi:hypothetical protein